MHLLRRIAIQSNIELKTQPKQLLGSLLLDVLPNWSQSHKTFRKNEPLTPATRKLTRLSKPEVGTDTASVRLQPGHSSQYWGVHQFLKPEQSLGFLDKR
jgi:hypothetical protein